MIKGQGQAAGLSGVRILECNAAVSKAIQTQGAAKAGLGRCIRNNDDE